AFKLPPPLQPLSPLALHGSQSMLPPSPTSAIQQQNASPPQSSHSRYERILPKQLADQRELARKVSHSAIERRRRERINDKIMQLKELIPSCADQDHLHKLSILQSSIEYIQYLQELVITLRKREKDVDKSDNDGSLEDESGIKDISDSEKLDEDDNISTITDIFNKTKKPLDHEEANALLMLSKSTTTATNITVQSSKPEVIMKDSETQTSPILSPTLEWEKLSKESKESESVQESEKGSPRRGMTVQQLLC
ncbi:21469_t:CDS:2, partial [Racocetra persica]